MHFKLNSCVFLCSFGSTSVYMYEITCCRAHIVAPCVYFTHVCSVSPVSFFLFSLSLCVLFMSLFLASLLYSVKPWPLVRESPYGPTAGPFSLSHSLPLFLLACVHTCPLSVFPHCQQPIGLAVPAPLCRFALGPAAGV